MNQKSADRSIRFHSWQAEVEAAVKESNTRKLLERVHAAEVAIFDRLQALAQPTQPEQSQDGEHDALAQGLETLRTLKRDRLGFPDWVRKDGSKHQG